MIIYAVLGSAPDAPDRVSIAEAGERNVLISFYDYPRAFTSLALLNLTIQEKLYVRQQNDRES